MSYRTYKSTTPFSSGEKEVVIYDYYVPSAKYGGFGYVVLRAWKGGGHFFAITDYGNYAYAWGSIGGDGDIRRFLIDADKYYLTGKFAMDKPDERNEFSIEATIDSIREEIIRVRREKEITKEVSRDLWNKTEDLYDQHQVVEFAIDNSHILSHNDDYFLQYRYSAGLRAMRDCFLPRFKQILKEQLDKEKG